METVKNNTVGAGEYDKGLVIVLSAPSGAGKTSVLQKLLKLRSDLTFSVSVTTRSPRTAERDGIDYHFVSDEQFDDYINNDDFIEWAEVHGFRYGTLKKTLESALDAGDTVVLDADTVGAFNIKKCMPDAALIFIAPPSPHVLGERLRNRNTESPERLKKRLSAVPHELARMKDYDYIVVNDDLDEAVSHIDSIINAERLKPRMVLSTLSEWRTYLDGE